MQVYILFLDEVCKFWHITCISATSHHKVINSKKQSIFLVRRAER